MTTNIVRSGIVVALVTVLQTGAPGARAAAAPLSQVGALYADAMAGEKAVQAALAAPDAPETILKAVRTVVADFENVVRRFPASGYSDDALWHAARVSSNAFEKFGDQRERRTAIRLLQELTARYPSSKLVRQVPKQLAALEERATPPDNAQLLEGQQRDRSVVHTPVAHTPVAVSLDQQPARPERPVSKPADGSAAAPSLAVSPSSSPTQPARLATIKA